MGRKQNFQPIAWFYDLYKRDRLDLNPPYQRRSVWNQAFKDYFIETVLLEYPAPAIFLYEDISPDGVATYHVVDGKQRLTTIFEFVDNLFPVSDSSSRSELGGRYFKDLNDDTKKTLWAYQFSVEYLPSTEDAVVNNIFDRINRNVARLTPQELRHARYDGVFITAAEDLAMWMQKTLPQGFPNIADRSRKQMKDVEFVAQVLLLLEEGPKGYSTAQLDDAFAARDTDWEAGDDVISRFRMTVEYLRDILDMTPEGPSLSRSRIRNQADCYSLIGAIDGLERVKRKPTSIVAAAKLQRFVQDVENELVRGTCEDVGAYYEAARSASNDSTPRQVRVDIMKKVLAKV